MAAAPALLSLRRNGVPVWISSLPIAGRIKQTTANDKVSNCTQEAQAVNVYMYLPIILYFDIFRRTHARRHAR